MVHSQIPIKDLEELLKDTGVLTAPDASRWKWESVRILLKVIFFKCKVDARIHFFLIACYSFYYS